MGERKGGEKRGRRNLCSKTFLAKKVFMAEVLSQIPLERAGKGGKGKKRRGGSLIHIFVYLVD